jgi:small-conductance mechanosensitive channel
MRMLNRGPWLRGIGVGLLLAISAASQSAVAPSTVVGQAQQTAGAKLTESAPEPADLIIANRHIFTMRAEGLGTAPPSARARTVSESIGLMVEQGGPLQVTTQELPEGVAVLIDGRLAFRVLNADVDPETGETLRHAADGAVQNLTKALAEVREARDARAMLPAFGYALLATVLLAGALWLLLKAYRWFAVRAHGIVRQRFSSLMPDWANHVVGEAALAGLFTLPLKLLASLIAVLLTYEWTAFVLQRFPYTRPWGEALFDNLLQALGGFGVAMLKAVPGLMFVALIIVLTRIIVRAVRAFFDGVHRGSIQVGLLDDSTARPTGQLVITGIWILALVAAYPYIPGSGSEAFRGIGVFVGLMLSLGASGIVNQAVSGLMLMYTRALRPGEFVQIGEHEGTVKSVGFVTTRIETLRHEEISIPNAVIATSVTRNYSRLAADGGLWIATKVTIGYDTPWRQVHAMLELAAARTEGIEKDPAPRVRQTALQDFYVEYTLLVCITRPEQRVVTLDKLHGNIQDVFNESGVQIMSPNYEADPESPKVVPRDKWFEPPAAR